MTTGKTIALTRRTFVGKVMSLLLNMLSRLVITFLPRSKCLLTSWLLSPSAVILEPPKIKPDTISTVSPSISYEVMGPDAMIFVFWMLSFKPTFSLSSFTFIKRLFSSSSLSAFGKQREMGIPLGIVIFSELRELLGWCWQQHLSHKYLTLWLMYLILPGSLSLRAGGWNPYISYYS